MKFTSQSETELSHNSDEFTVAINVTNYAKLFIFLYPPLLSDDKNIDNFGKVYQWDPVIEI